VVTYEAMKASVLASIPPGTEELNISAFDKGYQYGQGVLQRVGHQQQTPAHS
jgi:hypothetical protein